jgi:hypothetical protein
MIDITTRIKSGAYVSGKAIGIYANTSMRIRDRSYLNHKVLVRKRGPKILSLWRQGKNAKPSKESSSGALYSLRGG